MQYPRDVASQFPNADRVTGIRNRRENAITVQQKRSIHFSNPQRS